MLHFLLIAVMRELHEQQEIWCFSSENMFTIHCVNCQGRPVVDPEGEISLLKWEKWNYSWNFWVSEQKNFNNLKACTFISSPSHLMKL